MRAHVVFEAFHQRMSFERLLDDRTLDAPSTPVDESHFSKTSGVSLVDVFLDERRDVARREGMKVQFPFDGYAVRVVVRPGIHTPR